MSFIGFIKDENGNYYSENRKIRYIMLEGEALIKFLKDTKGNLYEVHTSAPITMTIDTASRVQEVSVTVPWQEVADASDAVIIQTSDDEGWSD